MSSLNARIEKVKNQMENRHNERIESEEKLNNLVNQIDSLRQEETTFVANSKNTIAELTNSEKTLKEKSVILEEKIQSDSKLLPECETKLSEATQNHEAVKAKGDEETGNLREEVAILTEKVDKLELENKDKEDILEDAMNKFREADDTAKQLQNEV